MEPSGIDAKLSFAERRMRELLDLNGGDLAGADPDDRDRQTAEYFSHLVSATEVLARYVNEVSKLGLAPDQISVSAVRNCVGTATPVGTALLDLYVNTRREPFPASDSYTDDALIYRILVYRNHTTHRRRAPFQIKMIDRTVHLYLDPEDPTKGASRDPIRVELPHMLELVRERCRKVIALL